MLMRGGNDLDGNLSPSCIQPPPTSPSATNHDGEYFGNPMEPVREESVNPLVAAHNLRILTWGRGGPRSHIRRGNGNGCGRGGRGTRSSRASDLVEHSKSSSKTDCEVLQVFTCFVIV